MQKTDIGDLIMAILTTALTTFEVLNQIKEVYDSKDPLLIRFRNTLKDKTFVVEYIGNWENIDVRSISSNCAPPESVVDFAFDASSWSNARVQIEFRGQQDGREHRIQLNYNWIHAKVADIDIMTKFEDNDETIKKTSGRKDELGTKAIRHSKWDKYDIILFTTGNVVEMTVLEKGVM